MERIYSTASDATTGVFTGYVEKCPQVWRVRPLSVQRIEAPLELQVSAAHLIDHLLGPVEVLALARKRPAGRRTRDDVAQVRDLVRQLYELGSLGSA
jgi:hypothetical protein